MDAPMPAAVRRLCQTMLFQRGMRLTAYIGGDGEDGGAGAVMEGAGAVLTFRGDRINVRLVQTGEVWQVDVAPSGVPSCWYGAPAVRAMIGDGDDEGPGPLHAYMDADEEAAFVDEHWREIEWRLEEAAREGSDE